MKTKNPVIFVIRDGWGFNKKTKLNAIAQANIPNTKELEKKYPTALLDCSGEAVGLIKGYQGNSEVGHMTIGSGRIIFQSLIRINKAIKDKSFFEIPEFLEAIDNCKRNNSALHIIGLLQIQAVHSYLNHLFALLDLCKKQKFKNVLIHAITDGRDAPVTESLKHLTALEKKIKALGFGKIVTVSGRYFAMDRDKRWDRTQKAHDCIVDGKAPEFLNATKYVKACHAKKETDEFITPSKLAGYQGMKNNDSIIFFNFRTDRTRQLTQAIVENDFAGFKREKKNFFFVAMTQYYQPMNAKVAFKDIKLDDLLGQVISKAGLSQLRISETEKYAHVTFFFNGQSEEPYVGEERILINSPKVATYDLKPEMSVYEIGNALTEKINEKKYDFIVTNLVNGDMVGHTGNFEAVKKGIEAVDKTVGQIVKAGLANNYNIFVFADHGNAEDKTNKWETSHTINKVPFVLVSNHKYKIKKTGGLKDVAPTALDILGLKQPIAMTGKSLIVKK